MTSRVILMIIIIMDVIDVVVISIGGNEVVIESS